MIIGLSGYARSGKDTVADLLVKNHGFVRISFADPMREALRRLDPLIRISQGIIVNLSQALRSMSWEDLKEESPDIRVLMQRMGTEVGRELLGENVWVDLAMAMATKHENVVISDVRFKNEAQAILDYAGHIWRIEREGVSAVNAHISETDLDGFQFSFTIQNNGTLAKLEEDVAYTHKLQDIVRWL